MNDMITITKDSVYKSDFSVVDIRNPNSLSLIPDDEIIKYLSEEVELGESVTFERIFQIINSNREKLNNIYHSCLGGYSLILFIDELNEIPTEKSDLKYLEIFWLSDKSDDDFSLVSGLHGIGVENTDNDISNKGDTIAYSIEFTPLNNLKYLPLKLNKEVVIMNYTHTDDDNYHIELGNKSYTLFDLFYAILFEISWNGDPTGRVNRLEELEENVENYKDELTKGEFKTFELEDILEMFDKNDNHLVKFKELRDRVDEDLSSHITNLDSLKSCLLEKLKLYDEIENSNEENLTGYYKKLTDNEFNMQLLYGLEENINHHRFWETPKCTCPKIDNVVNFPKGNYSFDIDCPIHRKF